MYWTIKLIYTRTYSAHIMLKPKIILHQNNTLFNRVLPRTHLLLCIITIGICSIMATNPYPRIFFVMQPMTNSCASALIKNVIRVATDLLRLTPRDAL